MKSVKLKRCIMMRGLFQLLMVYMVDLYKHFSDVGFKDVLVQSGIVAKGSFLLVMRRKDCISGVLLY